MFKFTLVLLCSFLAVQSLQARSFEPSEFESRDIVDTIKEIIAKLKNILENISGNISDIIKEIINKIKEIAAKIPEIINQIKEKIDEIIQLGEKGKQCVEANQGAIDDLITSTQQGMQNCINEAQATTEELQAQLKSLSDKINALNQDVLQRVTKCVQDSGMNPIKLAKCLREQVEPVKEQIVALEAEVQKTVELARETAKNAIATLTKCSSDLQEQIIAKEKELFDKIAQCMQN